MLPWLRSFVPCCWEQQDQELGDNTDPLVWSKDLERHSCGEFSYAVAQANNVIEDHSQVETGSNAIFVGIYDGHAGPDAAEYINANLFGHLIRIAREDGTISEETLKNAIAATEEGFLNHVRSTRESKPSIVVMGSCCLVGVIWKGALLIAHLGVCRAVVGTTDRSSNKIIAVPLTVDHNVNIEEIRREVSDAHPNDNNLIVFRNNALRIKGIVQVSRSIGDAYLKQREFEVPDSLPEFRFRIPLREPALSADPFLHTRVLLRADQFLIFASDGLWEHLTNQEAVEIVYKYPRRGIARRLLTAAQKVACKKKDARFKYIHVAQKGERRAVHDDITVVVVFIDHVFLGQKVTNFQEMSIKGLTDSVGQSNFRDIDDLM